MSFKDKLKAGTSQLQKHACPHEQFTAYSNVVRICEVPGGPVIGFKLDTNVKCVQCGVDFRFVGDPIISPDGTKLHIPLYPANVPKH